MRKISLLILSLLIAGCSRVAPVESKPPDAVAPVAQAPAPVQEAPKAPIYVAATLFPEQDLSITYLLTGAPVQEHLLREGDRAVAVAEGKAYAVWHFRPDGVWRADPRNPQVLLRYLPPDLTDGLLWRQRSGDADVWFSLRSVSACIREVPTCWEVAVVNRGERTVFRFAKALGPISAEAVDWADPTRSFAKGLSDRVPPSPLTPAERERILQGSLSSTAQPAPVVEAGKGELGEAVYQMLKAARPGLTTVRLDLNGDGHQDLVRGRLGNWTATPVEFLDWDGTPLGLDSTDGEHRVTQLAFAGLRRPAFLVERRGPKERPWVSILAARENPYMNTWNMEAVYGWAPKSMGAPADRVRWAEDGRITVEWDLGDPARHTRVSQYTWVESAEQIWANVKPESVTHRPAGAELVYPPTAQGVLEAAFVARWLGLTDELPRYFATPEAAAAFAADERVGKPDYGPGQVQIGKVTPPTELQVCGAEVAEAEPHGPGPHTFGAKWGGYEWCQGAWGQVTFGQDGRGRPVIIDLRLDGGTGHSM